MQTQVNSNATTFGTVPEKKKKSGVFTKCFNSLGRIGKALMFPIAILPIAAILNRLGAQVPANVDIENAPAFVVFVQTMLAAAGNTVFNNLHMLFAVGVGFGLTKDNRGEAALTALVGMILLTLIMGSTGADLPNQIYGSISFPLAGQGDGWSESMTGFHRIFGNKYDAILANNVLNGIIAGGLVAFIYNRFNGVQLPQVLGFFNGRRLVPVLVMLGMMAFGVLWAIIFPWIGYVLYALSNAMGEATGNRYGNAAISGIYVFLNRLLIPFGLHHVPNTLFWFVLGDHPQVGGGTVYGDINMFLNGVPEGNTAGTFQSPFFVTMMFGLPALVYAFYKNADNKDQKKKVLALFGPAALISFLTGITEPIEFAFMFVSPVLYLMHAVLAGIFGFITGLFGVQIGFGFSAGLLDYLLSIPKSLQIINTNKTGIDAVMANPGWIWVIGAGAAAAYFFLGNFMIKKFNLETPGRGKNVILNDNEDSNANLGEVGFSNKTKKLVLGLGGWDNITDYQNCMTRLRYGLKDTTKVNEQLLREGGATGVKKISDSLVHVIIGTNVEIVNNEIIANKGKDLSLVGGTNSTETKSVSNTLKKEVVVKSPIAGKVISLSKLDNGAFDMLGKGVAILPKESKAKFVSNTDSKVLLGYRTGHAYVLDQDNVSVMYHIGVNTNEINNNAKDTSNLVGFKTKYADKANETIAKGSEFVEVDFDKIKKLGYDPSTVIVALNETIENADVKILVKENQEVKVNDDLFIIKPKNN